MDVVVISSEGLQRKCEGKLDLDEIDRAVDDKIEGFRPTFHMRGFRPGKVPARILKFRFGKQLVEEVTAKLVEEAVKNHLEETEDKPIRPPNVEIVDPEPEGNPVRFTVDYECKPTFPEVNYSEIEIERPVLKDIEDVFSQDFETFIQNLSSVPVDTEPEAEADEDDIVSVNVRVLVDGSERNDLSSENLDVRVVAPESSHPFAAELKGMKAGDTRTVSAPLPNASEAHGDNLADYEIQVVSVRRTRKLQSRAEAESELGAEQVAQYETQLRERRQAWISFWSERLIKKAILDELDTVLDFELPPSMLTEEMETVRNALLKDGPQPTDAEQTSESSDEPAADSESPPESSDSEPPEAGSKDQPDAVLEGSEQVQVDEEEVGRLATRRLKLGLYLANLASEKEFSANPQEVEDWFRRRVPNQTELEEILEVLPKRKDLQAHAVGEIIETKSVRYVAELVSKQDIELSLDGFMARVRASVAEVEDDMDPNDMDSLPNDAG